LDKLSLQPRGNPNARALSIRDRIHDLAAAIRAISTRKELRVGHLTCGTVD
jgi:hypothetical protein